MIKSMSMVRRLAIQAPEKLIDEMAKLQQQNAHLLETINWAIANGHYIDRQRRERGHKEWETEMISRSKGEIHE